MKKNYNDVVNYIVKEGTLNTTQGNWIFTHDEINDKFNLNSSDYPQIIELLSQKEEVSDVVLNGEDIDVVYYGEYCSNIEITNEIHEFTIRLDNFCYDYDTYNYHDEIGHTPLDRFMNQTKIAQDIEDGNIKQYIDVIKYMLEDNDSETEIYDLNGMLQELENLKNNTHEKENSNDLQQMKQNISQKIKVAGFNANDSVVYNILKLDKLLGVEHSIKDIRNLQKSNSLADHPEANKLLHNICNEFKTQEIRLLNNKIHTIDSPMC